MNILLTGGNGVLGKEIGKIIPNCIMPSKSELNVRNKKQVSDFIQSQKIDVIIHTAALTSVRECENDKNSAWNTNVKGTQNLVNSFLENNPQGYFVYVSTACVFRGNEKMYSEKSLPNPANFYALTKLIGETIVQSLPNHLIIRTNFVGRNKWPYEKAFTDRFGTYLFAEQVANGINDVIKEKLTGIVHVVGDKKMSVFELAKITTPDVQPMTINDYSGPPLTMDMSLDTERWKKYNID